MQVARGLRFGGDDGDLLPDQTIHQCGLPRIRPAYDGTNPDRNAFFSAILLSSIRELLPCIKNTYACVEGLHLFANPHAQPLFAGSLPDFEAMLRQIDLVARRGHLAGNMLSKAGQRGSPLHPSVAEFTPSNSSTSPIGMLPRITRPPSGSRTTSAMEAFIVSVRRRFPPPSLPRRDAGHGSVLVD